ncbi:sporulation and spore germination protein [Natranaerovirga hydrolytica]|uniref:Sporulation and spore germination protein n=1 Tax=Natranaerovirga hydrolytica TaxID=680378 RepID=A0A4R1MDF9_9FIRM|nr:GerMN domain-containing protein [Natranaerovirga hydrolytica]TCK90496.1 sporulation and spore germination protein [Natranaerovirga hydrolytica]
MNHLFKESIRAVHLISLITIFLSNPSMNLEIPNSWHYREKEHNISRVYYYKDTSNQMIFEKYDCVDQELYLLEEQVNMTCNELFNNPYSHITLIPNGTEVVSVSIEEGHLELVVTNDIMNYGGNAREWSMVNQILATVFSIKEVERLTIYIEETGYLFPEGTSIKAYTRAEWEERKGIIRREWLEEQSL